MIRSFCVQLLSVFLLALPLSAGASSPLFDHPSPYLRLHATDAVQWRILDQSVLQQAKKENKLVFLSSGYFSCHWCHVMRDESFNNPAIADFINANFIPVKIDRELNPVLDAYLVDFMKKVSGYAGWPLNVFLVPDGYPLLGIVYQAPEEFSLFIKNVAAAWRKDRNRLNEMSLEAFNASRQRAFNGYRYSSHDQQVNQFLNVVKSNMDELEGGIGRQAKFPRPTLLLALLNIYHQRREAWLKEFLLLTLNQLAAKGLHDVIGGGFFRYAVDPGWQVPHFEKMLYTNAGLIRVYIKAYEIFEEQKYLDIAVETIEFLIRDMGGSGGGFISALSAQDEQGVEGGHYLWDLGQLKHVLSSREWQRLTEHWELFEFEEVARVLPAGVATGESWKPVRNSLLQKRNENRLPRDEKLLPSWNAYLLSAMAETLKHVEWDDFIKAGDELYGWLEHRYRGGLKRQDTATGVAYLEDYAFVARGMRDWQIARGKTASAEIVMRLVHEALVLFTSEQGWKLSDQSLLPLPGDWLNVPDGELPSPSVILLDLIRDLRFHPGDDMLKKKIVRLRANLNRIQSSEILRYSSQVEFMLQQ